MVPIQSQHETRRIPVMTWLLVAVNAIVFFYELQLSDPALNQFILRWGVVPSQILQAFHHPLAAGSLHAYVTLLTSQFIHGGWLHIVGNMLFLLIFGNDIEARLGSGLYLLFYLVCGIIAGIVEVLMVAPIFGALNEPSIGASGAIAGVLGAYLILYPLHRVVVLVPILIIPIPLVLPAFVLIGWWFIQQLLYGILSLSPSVAQSGGVAFWAHVGGFLTGIILILPLAGLRPRNTWANVPYGQY